jgi:hypothetical protein
MSDAPSLKQLRRRRPFKQWNRYVAPDVVTASEESVRTLIDALIALGPEPKERFVRKEVTRCVKRFNKLDTGWICTIEREDIYECVCEIVEACGFDCDEDWLDDRDW